MSVHDFTAERFQGIQMSFDTKTQHSMPKRNLVFSLEKAQIFKYQMLFIYPDTKDELGTGDEAQQ
jgi:hypothetical protein